MGHVGRNNLAVSPYKDNTYAGRQHQEHRSIGSLYISKTEFQYQVGGYGHNRKENPMRENGIWSQKQNQPSLNTGQSHPWYNVSRFSDSFTQWTESNPSYQGNVQKPTLSGNRNINRTDSWTNRPAYPQQVANTPMLRPSPLGTRPFLCGIPNNNGIRPWPKQVWGGGDRHTVTVPRALQIERFPKVRRLAIQLEQPVRQPLAPPKVNNYVVSKKGSWGEIETGSRSQDTLSTTTHMRGPIVTTYLVPSSVVTIAKPEDTVVEQQHFPPHCQIKSLDTLNESSKSVLVPYPNKPSARTPVFDTENVTVVAFPKLPPPSIKDIAKVSSINSFSNQLVASSFKKPNSLATSDLKITSTTKKMGSIPESYTEKPSTKQLTTVNRTTLTSQPKKLIPFRPNFGQSVASESEDEDLDDEIFECPTSPLIHMSESAVPLIQQALKSTAKLSDVMQFSPEINNSNKGKKLAALKEQEKSTWRSSIPSEPFRPSFLPDSSATKGKPPKTKDGKRKAVRRPKNKANSSTDPVEFLFPPTSPIPALQARRSLSHEIDKVMNESLKKTKPTSGVRPLVVLAASIQSPNKGSSEDRAKESICNEASKPKTNTQSYTHLSEHKKANHKDKDPQIHLKMETEQEMTISLKELQKDQTQIMDLAHKHSSNSSVGELQKALRTSGKKDTNRSEKPTFENPINLKRKRTSSTEPASREGRQGKRLKFTKKVGELEPPEFRMNPVAVDLFGSLPKPDSSPHEAVESNLTHSSLEDHKVKVELKQSQKEKRRPVVKSDLVDTSSVDPPPRSNNGLVFLIDGVTAASCIPIFTKRKIRAECFVTRKFKIKKRHTSKGVAFHVHPSVGHQLTYFCARHVTRWKCAPVPMVDAKIRNAHKIFLISKDARFSMLIQSLKADGLDVAVVKERQNLKTLLNFELK